MNDAINRRKLKRALSNEKKTIIWQFDHNRFVNTLGLSKKERRVYHIADPYMNAVNNKKISALADLLVCTSTKYLPFYQNGKKEPLYIPHAISEEEFHISPQKVKALEKHFGGYVLMVGGLNHDVDFDLLEQISNQFSLVILGKLQTKESEDWEKWGLLKEKDNVHALGVVHAKELKNYIAASKVCITAYQFDLQEKGGNRSPLKILNYIAQKKPVVTSIDSEVNELDGELIFCEKDKKSYLDRIAQLMQTEKFDMNEELIIQFLGERTYPKMIEKIFEKLNED
ncbi:glycosyltransferase [Sediminitomix flava]|uniref:glycosyltransferase n=1 Tax=Sediminitomix flava TaxID=379075 RepID=UPI001304EEA7|nr:glycosyltransferase [Sediminitomix flava]